MHDCAHTADSQSTLKLSASVIGRTIVGIMIGQSDLPFRFISTSSAPLFVSRYGLVVRRLAGKQKDLGSIRFGSPFSSKLVVYEHRLVTFAHTLNET